MLGWVAGWLEPYGDAGPCSIVILPGQAVLFPDGADRRWGIRPEAVPGVVCFRPGPTRKGATAVRTTIVQAGCPGCVAVNPD